MKITAPVVTVLNKLLFDLKKIIHFFRNLSIKQIETAFLLNIFLENQSPAYIFKNDDYDDDDEDNDDG